MKIKHNIDNSSKLIEEATNYKITNQETLDAIQEVHHMIINKEKGYSTLDELWEAMYED